MPLYSAKYAFGSQNPYRENAWIQDQYNDSFIRTHILPAFEKLLASSTQEKIVIYDILCGDGFSSLKIFELLSKRCESLGRTLDYIGVDISAAQIEKANKLKEAKQISDTSRILFIQNAIETFQPEEEKADMVLCLFGLHLLEENLQQKLGDITRKLIKNDGKFIAIYPLRVAILFRAQQHLLTQSPWKELLGDKVIRYISDTDDPYKNAIENLDILTDVRLDTLDTTHHINREQFETFFKSWSPEFRGVFPEDKHQAYLDAIWATLISFGETYQEEGSVSPDRENIIFHDKIRAVTTSANLAPALQFITKAKL